jgi:hypothetical protein
MTVATTILHEKYWTSFDPTDEDLDYIINLLLEREIPLTTEEMTAALVEHKVERLEEEAKEQAPDDIFSYRPAETYKVGQRLSFPALDNLIGEVVGIRTGENPDIGEFDVIQIEFSNGDSQREFAAKLEDHSLNRMPDPDVEGDARNVVELILERHGDDIEARLEDSLEESVDILNIAGNWFPRALVAEINEGHLNLAEAVLDVAEGGPLPTGELLGHMELPPELSPQLADFSLDYALQEDERFDEVGPAGEVLWYLRRLEPPEVQFVPPRLESSPSMIDRSVLTDELLELEAELDDELSPLSTPPDPPEEVTISLIFPHWRVGALPLSARLRPMFPTAYEAPRIRFMLIDGHTGDRFPGWVVREHGYVFGLEQLYREYNVPAGGLINVRKGEKPGEVVVETSERRMQNDWIRTVTISEDGQIGFTMLKQPVGTAYDDRMVIGLIDPQVLDEAWMGSRYRKMPVDRLVAHAFRELAKLTPQTAVHAQTLYAGVNVVQRLAPEVVFCELVTRPYYVHVGDLYWRFEPSAWSQS